MAIDYVIDYDCIPKQTLTTEGIVERLKGEERANRIIELFRHHGDDRPPSEMGFELTRSTPQGEEETQTVVVQDLLDHAEDLRPLEHHCIGCPANHSGRPFGCTGFIQYPISAGGEAWLLDRLPVPDDSLVWLLMRQGIEEFHYNGASVRPLREASDTYFESRFAPSRRLGEFTVDGNQLFEMIFAVGHINPNHAALLLLFLHAIPRDLEADQIMNIQGMVEDAEQSFPFLIKPSPDDEDVSVAEFKTFLHALYVAWRLGVSLRIDA
jgi:hypothetical protein